MKTDREDTLYIYRRMMVMFDITRFHCILQHTLTHTFTTKYETRYRQRSGESTEKHLLIIKLVIIMFFLRETNFGLV